MNGVVKGTIVFHKHCEWPSTKCLHIHIHIHIHTSLLDKYIILQYTDLTQNPEKTYTNSALSRLLWTGIGELPRHGDFIIIQYENKMPHILGDARSNNIMYVF